MRRGMMVVVVVGLVVGLVTLLARPQDDFTFSVNEPQSDAPFRLRVGDFSCDLSLLERETLEPDTDLPPDVPVYTLSSNCDQVAPRLRMVLEGTLWLGVSAPDERDWLPTRNVDNVFAGDVDPYPAQLDRRGRWFGCVGYEVGDYTCRVLVGLDDAWHLIAVPVTVLEPGYPPAPTATP